MNSKLSKILTLVAGLIGLIGFFFFIRIMMEGDEALKVDADLQNSILSPFINFSIIVLVVTAIIAVVFSAVNMVKNPQVLKRTLLGVGLLLILLFVAYSVADDGAVMSMGKVLKDGEAGSVSKWVSTGINFSAILGVIGFGAFFIDFVKSLVKN
jgi:glucan phosphoethanolaminetransferase (alkaline phosphatase superfamily)